MVQLLETKVNNQWGHIYIPKLDVTYIRNEDGTYSVWSGGLETYSDGEPCWAPFATFQTSYDRAHQEMVEEVAAKHGHYYGASIVEQEMYGFGYDPRTFVGEPKMTDAEASAAIKERNGW